MYETSGKPLTNIEFQDIDRYKYKCVRNTKARVTFSLEHVQRL